MMGQSNMLHPNFDSRCLLGLAGSLSCYPMHRHPLLWTELDCTIHAELFRKGSTLSHLVLPSYGADELDGHFTYARS